jgi:hypothetical protein
MEPHPPRIGSRKFCKILLVIGHVFIDDFAKSVTANGRSATVCVGMQVMNCSEYVVSEQCGCENHFKVHFSISMEECQRMTLPKIHEMQYFASESRFFIQLAGGYKATDRGASMESRYR